MPLRSPRLTFAVPAPTVSAALVLAPTAITTDAAALVDIVVSDSYDNETNPQGLC